MKTRIRNAFLTGFAVIAISVVGGCGPEKYKAETKGSDTAMQDYQKTGTFYRPPAGAPVPGAVPGGPPMGGAPQGQ